MLSSKEARIADLSCFSLSQLPQASYCCSPESGDSKYSQEQKDQEHLRER